MKLAVTTGIALLIAVTGTQVLRGQSAIERVRSIVEQWVSVEKAISSEAQAWKEKERSLRDLIELGRVDRDNLNQQIVEFQETATAADEKRAELVARQKELDQSAEQVVAFLNQIEPRLRQLEIKLPTPLRENLAGQFQKLPTAEDTSLDVAERMQTVVTLLVAIQRFDRSGLTVHAEVRKLNDGTEGEVKTLYVGLGTAYYLSESDNDAGYGIVNSQGWQWESSKAIRDEVREAIEIVELKALEPKFILLPVKGIK